MHGECDMMRTIMKSAIKNSTCTYVDRGLDTAITCWCEQVQSVNDYLKNVHQVDSNFTIKSHGPSPEPMSNHGSPNSKICVLN